MSDTYLLLRNSAFSLIATLMGRVSASIAFIFIARFLGPAESGVYALGISFAMVSAGVAFWGLDQVLARDVAAEPLLAGRYVANFLAVRVVLASLTLLAVALLTRWPFAYDSSTANVIILMSLAVVPDALDDVWQSLFVAFEQVNIPALTSVITGGVRLIAAYWVLNQGGTVEMVALVVVATGLLRLGLDSGLGLRCLGGKLGRLSFSFCMTHLREALPFLFVNICIVLRAQADTILLSLWLSEYEVGLYRSALTIVTAVLLLPQAYRVAALPTLSRLYRQAPAAFERMYGRSTFYLTLLVLPISVVLVALAEPILGWLYGAAFVPAAGVLRILALGLIFEFLVVPNMRVLVVIHRQDIAAKFQGLSTVVGLVLAIVLIPPLRMLGAALARVIAAAVLFIASYQYVRRRITRYDILRSTWRLVVAAAFVAAMLYSVSPRVPLIASLLLAGVTYLAGLVLLCALPKEDWQRLRRLLHVPGG